MQKNEKAALFFLQNFTKLHTFALTYEPMKNGIVVKGETLVQNTSKGQYCNNKATKTKMLPCKILNLKIIS